MAAALASRYARALADVVTRPDAPPAEQTSEQLRGFLAALGISAELRHALLSPAVAPASKKAVIARIGERLGFSRATRNFLYVVTDNRRLALLDQIVAAFETLLDERRGVERVEVRSARAIEPDQQPALAARLSRLTGKQARLEFAVDPSLLGGAVARIGSTVYDGSVRGRLQALQRRLTQE